METNIALDGGIVVTTIPGSDFNKRNKRFQFQFQRSEPGILIGF